VVIIILKCVTIISVVFWLDLNFLATQGQSLADHAAVLLINVVHFLAV